MSFADADLAFKTEDVGTPPFKDYRLKAGRILWRLKVAVTAEAV